MNKQFFWSVTAGLVTLAAWELILKPQIEKSRRLGLDLSGFNLGFSGGEDPRLIYDYGAAEDQWIAP